MNTIHYLGYEDAQALTRLLDGTTSINSDTVRQHIQKLADIYTPKLSTRPYKMTLDLFILIMAIAGACAIAGILAALGYDAISSLTSQPANLALSSLVVTA